MQNYDKVHNYFIEAIKESNEIKIKSLLKKYNIRNIAGIKNLEQEQNTPFQINVFKISESPANPFKQGIISGVSFVSD